MEKLCLRRRRISWSCCKKTALAVFFLSLCFCLSSEAQARWIRVGLMTAPSAPFSGRSLSGRDGVGRRFSLPASFSALARGSNVVIQEKSYASPVIVSSPHQIRCGNVSYEGELVLRARGGQLTVINRLDVEKYLRGVLGYEINPQWAMEALKAQAVISRTYALAQMGRHEAGGYDVCTTDHCQVYRGTNVLHASTDRAIAQTRGQVLTYRGDLAHTFFCSDSGGATADVGDVWGKSVPYLVVRREPFSSESPKARWEASLSAGEIQNALAKKGKSVGTLSRIAIERRDAAGRAAALRFTGSAGSSVLSSAAFRTLIGAKKVRSTFFEFSPEGPRAFGVSDPVQRREAPRTARKIAGDAAPLTAAEDAQLKALIEQKKFSVDERLDMILYPERRRDYLYKALGAEAPETEQKQEPIEQPAETAKSIPGPERTEAFASLAGGGVTLYGRGWGHGVGLSQWGAKAMADRGWPAEKILEFYYPGTAIQKR